ncbi:MAG: imidazolonepropionase [Thermodesulfobacteriota bacterium]
MNTPSEPITLWKNLHLATMTGDAPYGAVTDGAIAVCSDQILWIGKEDEIPRRIEKSAGKIHDGNWSWVTPGLVDCHTHLVYAGNRAFEFELRLKGATYEEISRRGGGILSTVFETRKATEEDLLQQSSRRLLSMMAEGVTTLEIKSGYGLDLETELKMLRAAGRLGKHYPVTIAPTFLGAHAIPPEYKNQGDSYIEFLCSKVIPKIAEERLASAVDAFCDRIGFSIDQTEKIFKAANAHGLSIKLHAEQLSNQKGVELAARYGALSVDHLEYLSETGVAALAGRKTVAVLLPGAFYFIRERQKPPVALLRKHKIPMAVSTDCNPGTSPTTSLLLMLNMACVLFGLTPEEALSGVTVNAAKALGFGRSIGTLEAGKTADFVLWEIDSPAELCYGLGWNPCRQIVRHGKIVQIQKEKVSPEF